MQSLRWRILLSYAALILIIMVGLALYLSNIARENYIIDLEARLASAARLAADTLAPQLAAGSDLDAVARRDGELLGARVTLMTRDGAVLGESTEDSTMLDNHFDRPEVQQALAKGQGSGIRFSDTVHYSMLYVAVAAQQDGRTVGIVRVAVSLQEVDAHVAELRQTILLATLLATSLAIGVALLLAERIARPLRWAAQVAQRIASGDLRARLLPAGRDEVGRLTSALNNMAQQLEDKVSALEQGQARLAAVLEHMADGVLITARDGQVLLVNPAAQAMLGLPADRIPGASFAELVRYYQLIELWDRCEKSKEEQVALLELERGRLSLQAIVTPLQEAATPGFLVVLQDLTRLRRLETVRQDFVSNVSHELRTPLASLKAVVETLRGGALEDPPAAQQFLDWMETEVDSLTQVVQELLELSRIESGQAPLQLQPIPVNEVLASPVDRLRPQAERAGLALALQAPAEIPLVLADPERIRQVVVNLVHNAIKFTPAGGQVYVSAHAQENEVVFAVRDTGVGISTADLPRIFERFYKADRTRSGGGTGLGLSIAKHIVQGHGGRIWAESVEGRGSTFYFTLRAAE